ncbi:MAG: ABC transporter permease [Deltaproteobacteria bacterium]|jgi:peptide/nickel transport system permease protein|nr:ABC transporter permease [Deltaproteobacteria bacterium]
MKRYIFRRLIRAVITIIGISIIVFSLVHVSGDPVALMLPPESTKEDMEAMRISLGFDKPLYVQYWKFFSNAIQGDFGMSIRWQRPCMELFLERFPNTLLLGITSMIWALFMGLTVGILSAVYHGRWFDSFGKIIALVGQALPVFWLGLMLMVLFAEWLGWLPTSGIGTWQQLILPSLTLGAVFAAAITRLTRSTMLDVMDSEYIKMARTLGIPERIVVIKQGFKNAAIPVLTLAALNFIVLINGTVITESIFNWPGIGRLSVEAIFARDYPVVQTIVLIASSLFVFMNLLVDVLYAFIDPRIRYD